MHASQCSGVGFISIARTRERMVKPGIIPVHQTPSDVGG